MFYALYMFSELRRRSGRTILTALGLALGGGFPQLSEEERRQLQQENGPRRFGLRNLGKPGTKFSRALSS